MKYIGAFLFDIVVMLVAPFAYAYDCADGYVLSNNVVTNFTAPLVGSCNGLYAWTSDMLYVINDDPIKCGPGSYPTADGCATWAGDADCPTNYYVPTNSFARPDASGACASGSLNDTIFDYCRTQLGETSPDLCTPQRPCTAWTSFKASNGLSWPLFMDKVTNPAMGFKVNADTCYMNLLNGRDGNNLNVMGADNQIYHGVK